MLLRWVFEEDLGNDEALNEAEQELFGKRPLDEKSKGYGCLGYSAGPGYFVGLDFWTFPVHPWKKFGARGMTRDGLAHHFLPG